MNVEARLSKLADDIFAPWYAEDDLRLLLAEEIELSKGFLRVQFEKLFRGLDLHWLALLAGAGIFAKIEDVSLMVDFPDDIGHVWPILIGSKSGEKGEVGLLGVTEDLHIKLCESFAPNAGDLASELLVEYLVCRLIGSLTKSWVWHERMQMFLLPTDSVPNVTILGVVQLKVRLDSSVYDIYFGFNPETTKSIDALWSAFLKQDKVSAINSNSSSTTNLVSVELCEIKVPQTKTLLDYLCVGAIIDLGVSFQNDVQLRMNGRNIGFGKLHSYDGRFAVQVSEISHNSNQEEQGGTSLSVEIASLSLSSSDLDNNLTHGAILTCNEELSNKVSLIIGREVAARAELGMLRGNLTLLVGG